MPGVSQGFNKLVTGFHGEITAMTLGAEQIDVVWNERQSEDQASRQAGRSILDTPTWCPNNDITPQITERGQWVWSNWFTCCLADKMLSYMIVVSFLFNHLHRWSMDSGLVITLCWFDLQTLSIPVVNFLQGDFLLCLYSPNRPIPKRRKKSYFQIAWKESS